MKKPKIKKIVNHVDKTVKGTDTAPKKTITHINKITRG